MAHYSFLFPIAGKVLEILASPLIKRLSLAWDMKDDLEKFEKTLSSIHAVLLDADEKQHQKGSHQLHDWLGKLKTALFEADALLDDFQVLSLRHQTLHRSITGKVSGFLKPGSNKLIFQFKMSDKIKKMRERFDEIASDRIKFSLAERLVERDVVVMRREMTHSFVDESGVIGRNPDKENIIRCCLKEETCSTTPFVSIIGIGGLGKTTLAQMVYNDNRVIDNFDLRIWVCISDNFVLAKIIQEILKSIGGVAESANYMHLGIDQLQRLLRQKLEGKKYLLVLDDVWNEERDKWVELINLLTSTGVATASKVIVTARSELVSAALAPRTSIHKLKALSDNDSLSILVMWAFAEIEDAKRFPHLVKIGHEIVKKCKGNPLAVRTLGKFLYMKTEECDWAYIRDNDVWEDSGSGEGDIMPALKLSYYQLPSHLKQCFAYCSLFPKDYKFCESRVVEIWRAQGLIRSEQFKTLEATGKEYFGLLTSRGFFQRYLYIGVELSYTMHDLVHDLAQSVAKPDCISKIPDPLLLRSIKVQHLTLTEDGPQGDRILSELLELQPQLRTFFTYQKPPGSPSSYNSFIETSMSRFKLLRVLLLVKFTGKELPESICSLWHLRYLDLTYSSIKSIPNLVCDLVCLEVLRIHGCMGLEKLPVGLGKLIRLKTLSLTTKEKCLPEKEFRFLTSLQTLFIFGCGNMESLLSDDGIECLSSLQTLSILKCKSLVSLPRNGIRNLQKLENLTIGDCEKLDLVIDDEHRYSRGGDRAIHSISILGFPMLETLPLWLLHDANSLKQILIHRCPNLTTLMPELMLENLKCLQRLDIESCPELKSLPIGMHHLTALIELFVIDCPQLVSRCRRETGEDWNKISHVAHIFLDDREV